MAIVVVDRGWVFVGRIQRGPDELVIHDASCIRRWGTTQGLGELALHGPRPKTVLDPMGAVRIPARAVIFTLETEVSRWSAPRS